MYAGRAVLSEERTSHLDTLVQRARVAAAGSRAEMAVFLAKALGLHWPG